MAKSRRNWETDKKKKLEKRFLLLTGFCLLFTASCAISHGVYHTVESGQTLWRIAKAYNVDIQDIAEQNNILDQTQIKVGQRIFIPGVSRVLRVEPYRPVGNNREHTAKKTNGENISHSAEEPEGKIVLEKWRFSWPVKGEVISSFGVKNGKKCDGIDIAAPTGTPVSAAAEGEVIYSDNGVKSYGNIVMLKHKQGFITLYAHNKENLVKIGEVVKKGDVIAK
ncbi:MAG: M23 family metallopeptidase, partial [Deltaproteobacteria bacterium]|nr:M23 family metallopeptidase [Deltaproteobacteria bacterium]